MPIKFEQDWMKNEGGVRENVKWTHTRHTNDTQTNDTQTNDKRQTLGVTDAITTAVSIPQC